MKHPIENRAIPSNNVTPHLRGGNLQKQQQKQQQLPKQQQQQQPPQQQQQQSALGRAGGLADHSHIGGDGEAEVERTRPELPNRPQKQQQRQRQRQRQLSSSDRVIKVNHSVPPVAAVTKVSTQSRVAAERQQQPQQAQEQTQSDRQRRTLTGEAASRGAENNNNNNDSQELPKQQQQKRTQPWHEQEQPRHELTRPRTQQQQHLLPKPPPPPQRKPQGQSSSLLLGGLPLPHGSPHQQQQQQQQNHRSAHLIHLQQPTSNPNPNPSDPYRCWHLIHHTVGGGESAFCHLWSISASLTIGSLFLAVIWLAAVFILPRAKLSSPSPSLQQQQQNQNHNKKQQQQSSSKLYRIWTSVASSSADHYSVKATANHHHHHHQRVLPLTTTTPSAPGASSSQVVAETLSHTTSKSNKSLASNNNNNNNSSLRNHHSFSHRSNPGRKSSRNNNIKNKSYRTLQGGNRIWQARATSTTSATTKTNATENTIADAKHLPTTTTLQSHFLHPYYRLPATSTFIGSTSPAAEHLLATQQPNNNSNIPHDDGDTQHHHHYPPDPLSFVVVKETIQNSEETVSPSSQNSNSNSIAASSMGVSCTKLIDQEDDGAGGERILRSAANRSAYVHVACGGGGAPQSQHASALTSGQQHHLRLVGGDPFYSSSVEISSSSMELHNQHSRSNDEQHEEGEEVGVDTFASRPGTPTNHHNNTVTETAATGHPYKRKKLQVLPGQFRKSLIRVGSRIILPQQQHQNGGTGKPSAATAQQPPDQSHLKRYPASPTTRASNYNHVQDAVALNFQEAVAERFHGRRRNGGKAVPLMLPSAASNVTSNGFSYQTTQQPQHKRLINGIFHPPQRQQQQQLQMQMQHDSVDRGDTVSPSLASSSTGLDNDDDDDPNVLPLGVTGLRNLGNTCYMNSSLQCLSQTIPLTDYFLGYDYRSEINKDNFLGTGGKLATEYAELVKSLWLGQHTTVKPMQFKQQLQQFAPQFAGYQQHDAQECLAVILDGIHEDLNRIQKKPYIEDRDCDGTQDEQDAIEAWKNYLRRDKSLIVDIFQGQLRQRLQCCTCHHVNIRFEPFMYLSLPISEQCKTVSDCLDLYLQEERLSNGNQWYCAKCKQHRDATKKTDLWILPPILIVHLKRFRVLESLFASSIQSSKKNAVPIDYPLEQWDLSSFVKSRGSEYPLYDLYAVSNHLGGGMGGGHYTAYGLNRFDECWYEFNDSTARRLDHPADDVLRRNSSAAYLLFYNRSTSKIPRPASPSLGKEEVARQLISQRHINGHHHPNQLVPHHHHHHHPITVPRITWEVRPPLVRRQSVSRPDLWPHTQVQDRQFREFARVSIRSSPNHVPLLPSLRDEDTISAMEEGEDPISPLSLRLDPSNNRSSNNIVNSSSSPQSHEGCQLKTQEATNTAAVLSPSSSSLLQISAIERTSPNEVAMGNGSILTNSGEDGNNNDDDAVQMPGPLEVHDDFEMEQLEERESSLKLPMAMNE